MSEPKGPWLRRLDPRLAIALAATFLWHGGLLISGSYRRTYDAYIHMFFGDHYARDWFSTWETRWYTGFPTTSYPPGSHQSIAVLSRFLGLEGAFVVVQLCSVLVLVVGVWRFSQIWVTREAAGWAALLAVVSSSIAEVVHVFGQLPTSFSLAILLNTLPSIHAWVTKADWRHFFLAVVGLAATTAGHHVTTLFGAVFFVGPVLATGIIDAFRTPLPDEEDGHSATFSRELAWPLVARRLRRIIGPVIRAATIGVSAIVVLIIIVMPYWLWSSSDPIVQIPIPHATRDNFLSNTAAGIVFFVVPWGVMAFLLPLALLRGFASRAIPLASSTLLLFVLGTGGTTPIPRLLLRGAFDILTLDRFTVWATITVLPMAGAVVHSLISGRLARITRHQLGENFRRFLVGGLAFALVVFAVLSANFARFRPLQPDRIDPQPIAAFMEKDQHDRWRYLTLGFGDQMAIVSAASTATTVDGNYHSARRLPELTSRSVERLEGAKFRGVAGIGSLQQFLATPERYSLKFVFSNDVFYDPLLWASGWHRLDRLQNGIQVWEREDIPPLPDVLPTREAPTWQRLMWGILPPLALTSAALAAVWGIAGMPVGALGRLSGPITRMGRRRWPARLYRRAEQFLARAAQRIPPGAPVTWHSKLRGRVRELIHELAGSTPGRRRTLREMLNLWRSDRWVQVTAVLCVLNLLAGAGLMAKAERPTPTETVEAYYDDLDFRRFTEAHDALDPLARPSLAQYNLALSVEDGLVASYGELDEIHTTLLTQESGRAQVHVELVYITSLLQHRVEHTHDLVQRGNRWHLTPEPPDNSTTPDQFARATEVTYLSQGRRQVTTEQTTFGDVLDRPRLHTLSATALEIDGRFAVVGEVTNLDVDPADLTVTAEFLDRDGKTLATHNAALATIHKALPRETVPFRIDMEQIAGEDDATDEAAGDFHPELFAAPNIDIAQIASVELSVKAVVTGRDLERTLHPQDLRLQVDDGQVTLHGQLRNSDVQTATIPHVLVTLLNEDGTVGWVDHLWVDAAIRPQRSGPFSLALTNRNSLNVLDDIDFVTFGNAITTPGEPFSSGALIELPEESGFSYARVTVHSFFRNPS